MIARILEWLTLCAVALSLMGCHGVGPGEARVLLKNASSADISKAVINLSGETVNLAGIKIGQTIEKSIKVNHDAHYDVSITLSNGRVLTTQAGYATNGISQDAEIIVLDDRIIFRSVTARVK